MKKAERMQWEKEQKVNRFIQIAQGIFFQKGYDTTTIDEVAQRAGYNKRTLYHYFKDKEELFLAVVLDALKLFNKKLQEAYDNPVEGHTKLYSMGKAFFTFFLEYPHILTL